MDAYAAHRRRRHLSLVIVFMDIWGLREELLRSAAASSEGYYCLVPNVFTAKASSVSSAGIPTAE
jgi:dienelactone hydrolase